MAKRKQPAPPEAPAAEYTVLARRYRPQQFCEIIGQEPVAQALANALAAGRVAHAYLFTGARGVGKTSTARILAKALNCREGPTATPCDRCDACRAIATGEDVDVLEVDGASNRGIDEIREIRQNVQYRPARGRYKVYIIDEVHMLTAPAFNALLKTLEEPPPHVKFVFATTEAQKIPPTILSRCQRFDFASIGPARIAEQLERIVAGEGLHAEKDALLLIARRAGGSMRDAQSLLDQLVAFGGGQLDAEQVRHLLGTANADRVAALATAVLERDPRRALDVLATAEADGVQLAELLDQLIEYWRDLLVVGCTGDVSQAQSIAPGQSDVVLAQSKVLSVDSVLVGLDILTTAKARLRSTGHARVLLEMTLVRLSRVDALMSLGELAEMMSAPPGSAGNPPRPRSAERAKADPAPSTAVPATPAAAEKKNVPAPDLATTLTEETLPKVWQQVLQAVGPILGSYLEKAEEVAILAPNAVAVRFGTRYTVHREHCQEPLRVTRTEEALRKITGQAWSLRVESVGNDAAALPVPAADAESPQSRYQRLRTEAMQDPLVKRAVEVLGAQIVRHDEGFGAPAPGTLPVSETTSED